MALTKQDHEFRQAGVGGSEIAALFGLDDYQTIQDVWYRKVTPVDEWFDDQEEETPDQWRGNILEPIAADEYELQTGREIRRQGPKVHPDKPFLVASVDRQIFAGSGHGEWKTDSTGLLEIKCPRIQTIYKYKAQGLPERITLQLQHYLGIYGYSWGSFAIFNAENRTLLLWDVQADEDLIAKTQDRAEWFWTEYVKTGIEPPLDDEAPAIDVPEVEGELTVCEGSEWVELAQDMREAKALRDSASDLYKTAQDQVKAMMKRAEIHAAEIPDVARFYYKPMKGRTSWKQTAEAIAKHTGVQIEPFIVKGDAYERFRPYFFGG